MLTAIIQFKSRINNTVLRNIIIIVSVLFVLFMVIARLLSGVHWITDIIGGVLLSLGLISFYKAIYMLVVAVNKNPPIEKGEFL